MSRAAKPTATVLADTELRAPGLSGGANGGVDGAAVAARAAEAGVATVWAAAAVAVLTTVLAACLHLGAALLARHRAESAADLAALAAAREAVRGEGGACRRAAEIATAMGTEVARCRLVGWNALVEVRVAVPLALPGLTTASGRAMAGPDPAGQPPVDERSMGTARRTAPAAWAAAACGRRSKDGSPHRQRARRCNSTNRRHTLAHCAGDGPTGTGSRWLRPIREPRSVAPQTAVGPERRLTPTPEPATPRRAAAVPLVPPTGRAGGGLPPGDVAAERVQHDVQHPHGARPCPAARCRCRTWATARTRDTRCGTRIRRSPHGWRRASRGSTS